MKFKRNKIFQLSPFILFEVLSITETARLKKLVKNINDLEKKLPLGRAGNPDEIGNFVKSIIKFNIKYLNGVIINFDGGLSKNLM